MNESEKRKPGWTFWTTSTLIMLALYVASVGPARWLVVKADRSRRAEDAFGVVYTPLGIALYILDQGPSSFFGKPLHEYTGWWTDLADK